MPLININMTKAQDIHKDVLREERKDKLAAADLAYMQADEAGDNARKAQIAAYKAQLRDMTKDPAFAAATTPDELKAVRPACLDAECP